MGNQINNMQTISSNYENKCIDRELDMLVFQPLSPVVSSEGSFTELTIFTQGSDHLLNKACFEKPAKQSGVNCRVCGKSFPNRSAKQYHKRKSIMCNVPDIKGRPSSRNLL